MGNTVGKIVILVPGEAARGGITNYYQHIKKDLPEHVIYFQRGARNWPRRSGPMAELTRMLMDYVRFIKLLNREKVVLLQTTTAFYRQSLIRDGLFLCIAKLFSVKRIVFFRGWDNDFAHNLSGLSLYFFRRTFMKCQAIIDLAKDNIKHLDQLGYRGKLYLETTLVGKELLDGFDIREHLAKRTQSKTKTILFMSRIEQAKGIYTLLEAFLQLEKRDQNVRLIFAGDGSQEDNLAQRVRESGSDHIELKGFVSGEAKRKLFEEAHLFVFLSEFEGMPNAVLEAMSFGLPVITTNVGGIASVFENNRNGVLLEACNPEIVAQNMETLLGDAAVYENYSLTNYEEAKNKFRSDIVAKRVMNIFEEILNGN